MLLLSTATWLLTGGVWAARSVIAPFNPDYWDPVTALDWSVACFALLPLAATFRSGGMSRLARLSVALFFGVVLLTWGGGLIVFAALGTVAFAPRWFQVTRAEARRPAVDGNVG